MSGNNVGNSNLDDNEMVLYSGLIGVVICLILSIFVLIVVVMQNYCLKTNIVRRISKNVVILNIIFMICGISVSVLDSIHIYIIATFELSWSSKDHSVGIILYSADIMWFISYILLYITLYYKLYSIFATSKYKISIQCHILFVTLVILCLSSMIVYMYFFIADEIDYSVDIGYVTVGFDFIISALILGLFIYKIKCILSVVRQKLMVNLDSTLINTIDTNDSYKMVKSIGSTLSNIGNDMESVDTSCMDSIENKSNALEFIMIRRTLLGCIGIVFTQAILLFNTVSWFLQSGSHENTHIATYCALIIYFCRALNTFIISFTLLLSFTINTPIYSKLCKKCHYCCQMVCFN